MAAASGDDEFVSSDDSLMAMAGRGAGGGDGGGGGGGGGEGVSFLGAIAFLGATGAGAGFFGSNFEKSASAACGLS